MKARRVSFIKVGIFGRKFIEVFWVIIYTDTQQTLVIQAFFLF